MPYDHWILEFFFAVHEVVFIFHIWAHQASSIVLCEVFACTYTHLLREMTDVLQKLIERGKPIRRSESESKSRKGSSVTVSGNGIGSGRRSDDSQRKRHTELVELVESKMVQRHLEPNAKIGNYDIMTLLADYKKMMLSTAAFNNWAGKLQG